MSVTVTATDKGEGTGITVTVTGIPPLHAVAVWSSVVGSDYSIAEPGDVPDLAFIVNGTQDLSLPNGVYVLSALMLDTSTDQTTVLTPIWIMVTDGTESVETRIMQAIQTRIQSLTLPGLDGDNVVIRKFPLTRDRQDEPFKYPGVLICPHTETFSPAAGGNNTEDIGYATLVTMAHADNQTSMIDGLEACLYWRERVFKAFVNQRLPGVPEVITQSVEPTQILVPDAWGKNILCSALVIRSRARIARGISP